MPPLMVPANTTAVVQSGSPSMDPLWDTLAVALKSAALGGMTIIIAVNEVMFS